MANIVLPLATLKNDSVSNINILTENGGTVYRTQSGEIIKQTLGALPETTQSDVSGLKFLAEQNGELKKVSYNGSTSSGGDNSGSEFFDVIFYGAITNIYCNEWTDVSSSWSTDWTVTDIINEMSVSMRLPRVTFVDTTNNLTFTLLVEAVTSEYITMSTTTCLLSNYLLAAEYCYYSDNSLQVLIAPVNPFADLEFYLQYDSNGDQVLSSNYTYSDLLNLAAMNIYPVQAKCYVDNELVGPVYLSAVGNGSGNFIFTSMPTGYPIADTTYISYFFQFVMTPDGDVYYETPASTYNEHYDILWYNNNNDEVGEIYLTFDPTKYSGYQFTGLWSYTSESGTEWVMHPDQVYTSNCRNYGWFNIEGYDSNMMGYWGGRYAYFDSTGMIVSNGIIGFSDGTQYNEIPGIMVPTAILGIKF